MKATFLFLIGTWEIIYGSNRTVMAQVKLFTVFTEEWLTYYLYSFWIYHYVSGSICKVLFEVNGLQSIHFVHLKGLITPIIVLLRRLGNNQSRFKYYQSKVSRRCIYMTCLYSTGTCKTFRHIYIQRVEEGCLHRWILSNEHLGSGQ